MKSEIKERIAQIRRGAVPSGYRKAAVGIIPSDWTQASVGEVCEINPPRSKTPDSVVTFLGMADVSEDGRILNAKTTDYAKVSKGFTPFQPRQPLPAVAERPQPGQRGDADLVPGENPRGGRAAE